MEKLILLLIFRLVDSYLVVTSPWIPLVKCNIDSVDPDFSGYAIDLLYFLAADAGITDDLEIECLSYDDMISAVINGQADFAIGAISMSASMYDSVLFSTPIIDSGLILITKKQRRSPLWLFLDPFHYTLWICWLFSGIFIGHVLWFIERSNKGFIPLAYVNGLKESMWAAYSSLFLVGDSKIRTIPGRLVQICYWFVAFIFLSAYIADLSTRLLISLNYTNINTYKDINDKKVGCFEQHEQIITNFKADVKSYENNSGNAEIMLDDLKNGDLDAVVMPKPMAIYLASQDCDLAIVGNVFVDDYCGIAFKTSIDASLYNRLVISLQSATENFYTRDLENKYLLQADSSVCHDILHLPVDLLEVGGLWAILFVGVVTSLIAHFIAKRLRKDKGFEGVNTKKIIETKTIEDTDLMVKFEKILGSSDAKTANKMKELEMALNLYSSDCLEFEESLKQLSSCLEENGF